MKSIERISRRTFYGVGRFSARCVVVLLVSCSPASDLGETIILDVGNPREPAMDGGVRDVITTNVGMPMMDRGVPDVAAADTHEPDAASHPQCPTDRSPWTPGMPAFRNVTEAWELTGIEGEYLSVTDVDGDNWPDVLVRKGGGPDDFRRGGSRHKWLLRQLR